MTTMGRRKFLKRIVTGLASLPLTAPGFSALAVQEPNLETQLFYQPLNGTLLRDIARKKHHHGPNRFHNPMGLSQDGRFLDLMRWKLFSANQFGKYLDEQPMTPFSVNWEAIRDTAGLSITFLKHAGLLIQDQERRLLVDPILDDIFWFIEDFNPPAMKTDTIPKPDHILITHGHYDHLDLPSLGAFGKTTHMISPLGYEEEFTSLGVQDRTQLDWFDSYTDNRLEITLLPCNHWTMRSPIQGPNTSLWGSYLIRTSQGYTIYVSGDTAYFDGFEQIGAAYDIDLAIFNLGAYEPRWFMAQSHINPRETVQAFRELKARKLMIVHWGAFRLGDEPVHFPPRHLRRELAAAGLLDSWVDLKSGETYYPGS
ncbi:MAG: MBL fold metallo-hydrolase [Thermodesulfobacteriota bacterium]